MKYKGPESQEWRKHTTWAHKPKKTRSMTTEAVDLNANTDGSSQSRPAKRQKTKQKKFNKKKFSKLSGTKMAQRAQEMRADAEAKEQAARSLLSCGLETAHEQLAAANLQREEAERHLKVAEEVVAAEIARKAEKLNKKEQRRACRPTRKSSWLKSRNPAVASTAIDGGDSLGGGMDHGTGGGTGYSPGLQTTLMPTGATFSGCP